MTTTNRAFIKVYRHDAAELGPGALASAARRRESIAAMSIEYVTSGPFYSTSSRQGASSAAGLTASIDVLGPPAQIAVDTTVVTPPRQDSVKWIATTKPPEPRPWRIEPPQSVKRPLSAYIARQRSEMATASGLISPSVLRPGTTVASFRWPAICRVLSRHCGSELDRLVDLFSQRAEHGNRMIGVLGLFPGSGCTTIALSIAERLAVRPNRTVLIDGNFSRPRLASWLDAMPTAGWQEVLTADATLADAIVHATDDHVDLLGLTASATCDPANLLAGPQCTDCASLLREAYDLAIIDLGAFFDARSQSVCLELLRRMEVDTVIAVTGRKPADARDLATVAEQVERNGCELIGVIENRTADRQATLKSLQSLNQ